MHLVRPALLACLACLAWLAGASPSGARPWLCLPPVFEGGQRLQANAPGRVYWLPPLLRQHEICWRAPAAPGELRIALIGNSSVYGLPMSVERTVGALLSRRFAGARTPAHFFNLAMASPYQVRDAVVIQAALAYDLDVIVYPMTASEFVHIAPAYYPTLPPFFTANSRLVERMAEAGPPGLEEPFERYRAAFDGESAASLAIAPLRESGVFARNLVRAAARAVRKRVNSQPRQAPPKLDPRITEYSCDATREENQLFYRDWQRWNVLAYLEQLQRQRDILVLVVHWPVAHEPVDDCYNVRFTDALVTDFVDWLAAEAGVRGLAYLDLHDLLTSGEFLDSLHVSPRGHRRIAEAIAPVLERMLEERRAWTPMAPGGR